MTDPVGSAADDADGASASLTASAQPTAPAPPPSSLPTFWVQPEPQATGPAPGYVYVGFWRRTVAFLIDGILLTIVSYAILIPMLLDGLSSADLAAFADPNAYTIDPVTNRLVPSPEFLVAMGHMMADMFRGLLIIFLIQSVYFIVFWTWRGASLGQMALGIEVRHETDGRRIGFWRSCLRYVGTLISAWIVLLGFIWVAFDARKQGWHDKIAGTYVVRRVR